MISRSHLTAVLVLAALVWSALLVLNGVAVSLDLLRPLSTVVGVVGFVLVLFERWIWRSQLLHPWFVSTPNLNGTWKGTFESDFIQEDGTRYPKTDAFLVVRQSLTSLSVRLITERSVSALQSGAIERERDGRQAIMGIYTAEARALDRTKNPPHHGATMLRIIGTPPSELDGWYWTDRNSKGELRFGTRIPQLIESFDAGVSAFSFVTEHG